MKSSKALTVLSILLVLVGILSIVFGALMLAVDNGSTGDTATFGADFYNYVNRNAARAATNTSRIIKTLSKGIGYCLIIAGFAQIIIGGMKLASNQHPVVINSGAPAPAVSEPVREDELPEL